MTDIQNPPESSTQPVAVQIVTNRALPFDSAAMIDLPDPPEPSEAVVVDPQAASSAKPRSGKRARDETAASAATSEARDGKDRTHLEERDGKDSEQVDDLTGAPARKRPKNRELEALKETQHSMTLPTMS